MSQIARGHLAMLLFSALVAGSFALGALAANEIASSALNAARFILAGVVIGAAALTTTGLPRKTWVAPWRYLLLGALFAIYFVLMFEGLRTAPAVSAAAVFTLTPVMAAGFGWLLLRQVTTPWMALALAVGACGALWVIFRADLAAVAAFEIGQGEMIYFWGCVAHALYTPMVRKLNRGEPAVAFSFGVIVAGSVLLYVALAASAATFVLLQFATLRLPSAKVMAYTYLTPSWVILWQIALGNPVPPLLVLGGVGLTVVALTMLLRSEQPRGTNGS